MVLYGAFIEPFPFTKVRDCARIAAGLARGTGVSAVEDQPVVRALLVFIRHYPHQFVFHLADGLSWRDAGAIGDPEDVGIHRDNGFSERGIQDHVGGFASDARQFFQGMSVPRHGAAVALHQVRAGLHEVARLGVVEPDGADMAAESFFSHGQNGLGGVGVAEESLRCLIDALVGSLRGEDHRNQQFEGATERKLAGGIGILLAEPEEDLAGKRGIDRSGRRISVQRFSP